MGGVLLVERKPEEPDDLAYPFKELALESRKKLVRGGGRVPFDTPWRKPIVDGCLRPRWAPLPIRAGLAVLQWDVCLDELKPGEGSVSWFTFAPAVVRIGG